MRRNTFGQLILNPNIRTFTEGGEGAGGDGQKPPAGDPPKTFTQDQINAILAEQKRSLQSKYTDYDELKSKAEKLAELENASKSELEKAQQRAEAAERALSEGRQRLAHERVSTALDRALNGRTVPPSALLALDKGQFVKGEGADADAIKAWAEQFPEATAPRSTYPTTFGQGQRQTVTPTKGERGAAEAARRFGGTKQ